MRHLYLGLKFSFAYFSTLPMKFQKEDNLAHKDVLASMLIFFPLVGLILGILTLFVFSFISHLEWYGAIISATIYMMLYGFLHTEAIIDVADAIYASHSGKDAYTIIKEPTVGAMGVLYSIGIILLKISGIVYLLLHGFFMEFLSILIISRLSILMLLKIHNFKSSFVTLLKNSLSTKYIIISFILFTIIGSFLTYYFIILLCIGVLIAFLISFYIKSKIKFMNGDVLGATLEAVETVLFLLVANQLM